ncbi:MAG: ComF family protein, partial [Desulfovibrionaceae bacterium]|nr:ComF family protein [Desulfovibrionaceae bacterium]
LCPACSLDLAPRLGGFCPGCGAMCADATQPPTVCGDCRLNPRPWAGLMFHRAYSGAMRELILAYKFKARLGLGGLLQKFALGALKKGGAETPEAIVPVPLHRSRLAWRGYNQSLELCRLMARRTGRPILNRALERIRSTPPQISLPANERRRNIHGAFLARPEIIQGRSVLLVDDVMTTGATLEECARSLKRAGAARITVLVLARTAGPDQDGPGA